MAAGGCGKELRSTIGGDFGSTELLSLKDKRPGVRELRY
jgi:hypothetical protein